jgi:hypothetical protein
VGVRPQGLFFGQAQHGQSSGIDEGAAPIPVLSINPFTQRLQNDFLARQVVGQLRHTRLHGFGHAVEVLRELANLVRRWCRAA